MSEKVTLKPGALLGPVPAVMVSLGTGEEQNILTISWTGIVNSDPPMTYISVRPSRHSYDILKRTGEFVINLTTEDLTFEMDHCGCVSGRTENKFEAMHLTPLPGQQVACPMIGESPVNLECKVTQVIPLGSHDLFLAQIVAIHADRSLLNEEGRLCLEKAHFICSTHGAYFGLQSKDLGHMGYSVMKPRTAKKRRAAGMPTGGQKPHTR